MKLMKVVTLLALLALFAGCDTFFEPGNIPGGNSGGEFAQVEVTIGGNARTLLPDAVFSKYVLSAKSTDENYSGAVPTPVEIYGTWGNIGIPQGEWIITATAYVNVGGTDYPAAKGSAPPISIYYQDSLYIQIAINAPETGGTGAFAYKVAYPSGGSASLELRPIAGGTAVVNAASVANGSALNANNIASGIYFLTVSATASGRTVTRNEVVHIYDKLTTDADYVFTKLDFGADSLQIGGTIKLLVNGVQPTTDNIDLHVYYADEYEYLSIDFTGTDGSATWECDFDNLHGANTLNFRIFTNISDERDILTIPVPLDDKTDISLGTVNIELETVPLTANTWIDGYGYSNSLNRTFYSMNVTAGQTYYLWWNDSDGDGTKTLNIHVSAYNRDLTSISLSGYDSAWYEPASFTAEKAGTIYIVAESWGGGTYAIAYSTDKIWHVPSFDPPNPTPLAADTWHDRNITTSSEDWYSIEVTQGQTYYFDWQYDSLNFNAFLHKSNGGTIWSYSSSPFTADSTGTVYLRVNASSWYEDWSGSYSVAYSTDKYFNTTPYEPPSTPTQLTADTWHDGNITSNTEDWYSINVVNGQTYNLWLNNANGGNGIKTASVNVQVYSKFGNGYSFLSFGTFYGSAWDTPQSFSVDYDGVVYLRVSGWSTGTYAIAYSSGNNRPPFELPNSTPLTADTWHDGIIASNAEDWYSINVVSGQTYNLWLNNANGGNGIKTSYANVQVYSKVGNSTNSAWDNPLSFDVDYDGEVYLKVTGSSGTYAIAYSTGNNRPPFTFPNPTPLTADTWHERDITTNSEDWYSINVTQGQTYYFGWNQSTLGIDASLYKSNGGLIDIISNSFSSFTADSTGTIYLKIYAYLQYGYSNGSYSVAYSTNVNTTSFEPPSTPTQLTADTWHDGIFPTYSIDDWYSIEVSSGTTYYLWLNNLVEGTGTKTSLAVVLIYSKFGNGNYFHWFDSAWDTPQSFNADYDGVVYLRVSGGSIGTYAIAYSTDGGNRPSFEFPNSTQLAADTWHDGNITTEYAEDWYSINVTEGQTYHIWWNDLNNGDGTKTLNALVSIYYSDGTTIFRISAYGYTVDSPGTIYLRVCANDGEIGTYAIAYSTNDDRPIPINTNPTSLTADTWHNGDITRSYAEDWYSINVTQGQTYYIWWNDTNNSSESMDIRFAAYYSNLDQIFDQGMSYTNSCTFTADSTDTVYLRVRGYRFGNIGTYAIAYSTSNSRPD